MICTLCCQAEFQSTLPARGATNSIIDGVTGSISISIHAPRTGSDLRKSAPEFPGKQFQSTLPARGATWLDYQADDYPADFNPRSPHGERHANLNAFALEKGIFQSTLPARGATVRN